MPGDSLRWGLSVSRETSDRLAAYADILRQWQTRINLVAPSTLVDLETRHFADSAQLAPMIPDGARRLVDLGSGADFPGLVLAILRPEIEVHLIESDQRKSAFLGAAARAAGVRPTIHTARVEAVAPLQADIVTARALAPLRTLLPWVTRHLGPGGIALLPKGRNADMELTELGSAWHMKLERLPSRTEPEASILRLTELVHVPT